MYDEKTKLALLEDIWGVQGSGSVIKSCAAFKISRETYYAWLKDPKFAQIASSYKKGYRQNQCSFWLNKSVELYEDEETPAGVKYNIIALNIKANGGFDKEEEDPIEETQQGKDIADIFADQMNTEDYQDLEPILEDDTEETPFEDSNDDDDLDDD